MVTYSYKAEAVFPFSRHKPRIQPKVYRNIHTFSEGIFVYVVICGVEKILSIFSIAYDIFLISHYTTITERYRFHTAAMSYNARYCNYHSSIVFIVNLSSSLALISIIWPSYLGIFPLLNLLASSTNIGSSAPIFSQNIF